MCVCVSGVGVGGGGKMSQCFSPGHLTDTALLAAGACRGCLIC